jgi:FKBP-type peptidyl-prolyl cis-trans isomerase SlyD
MKVGPGKNIVLDYQLFDEDGEVLDKSTEENPLCFIFGEGSIIPGLEKELEGMEAGEDKEVIVEPEDAYGPKDPNLVQQVPRERFAEGSELEAGMSYTGRTDTGNIVNFTVVGMDDENVEIDLNHPLAGRTLRFQVTIKDVTE